jgi:hypothetical protein
VEFLRPFGPEILSSPFLNITLKTETYEAIVSPLFLVGMKPGPSYEEAAEGKT